MPFDLKQAISDLYFQKFDRLARPEHVKVWIQAAEPLTQGPHQTVMLIREVIQAHSGRYCCTDCLYAAILKSLQTALPVYNPVEEEFFGRTYAKP